MPAVRISAKAFNDPRFALLSSLPPLSPIMAGIARMIPVWSWCTEKHVHVLPAEIVNALLGDPYGADVLLKADLAEQVEGGLRIKGTAGMIEWVEGLRGVGVRRRARYSAQRATRLASAQKPGAEIRSDGSSPIELRLGAALDRALRGGVVAVRQRNIGPYRVDFAIDCKDKRLVVEADGKDWHSSPEQVERDRIRDEYLRGHGWDVMHFTGSEIHRDAPRCAARVVDAIGAAIPARPKRTKAQKRAAKERRKAGKRGNRHGIESTRQRLAAAESERSAAERDNLPDDFLRPLSCNLAE